MLAPVKVLHMPDPRDLAIERLGADRAEELFRDGAAAPAEQLIEEVLAAPVPGLGAAADPGASAGATAH